ncbi:gamma-glutamyltransferase [candidate division KSB1 bacterium]|nr:gamma-glutamyltransferase [candidate division KSB1 bacterium]
MRFHKPILACIIIGLVINITACSKKPLPDGAFQGGVVVSTQKIASEVGTAILKKGGNAVDAAVAVSFALAVVHPSAGNIGGGGFMVIRMPDGTSTTIDYREKAPAKAHRDMYLDENGDIVRGLSTRGALAVGVPGTVAGTLMALEKYGTMSREEVIQPSIDLAANGWILDRPIGGDRFKRFPSSDMVFNKSDGSSYDEGELFVQKDLAKTLELIAEKGSDGFYKGTVADLFVKTMEEHNGLITHEDLANYQASERAPVTGNYRGYEIISMAPPSSGGTCLIQLLNILERYDIAELGWNTPETVHLVVEAERRVYADRAEYLGDSDFYDVPVKKLLSKGYADIRSKDIDTSHATPSNDVTHGDVDQLPIESEETTHYSVVDKNGMSVAVTTTLNGGYGSLLVVDGAGFLLNNEMDDFSSKPGEPNMYGLLGSEANAIEPNKRMLSSMTPTIVAKDGKNFMIIGTPGGSTIITTVLQCIMNVIDHGMSIREAVTAPRFHHQWMPDRIDHEEKAFTDITIAKLEALGHTLRTRGIGDAHGIIIDPENGWFFGGADPRSRSSAVAGY